MCDYGTLVHMSKKSTTGLLGKSCDRYSVEKEAKQNILIPSDSRVYYTLG